MKPMWVIQSNLGNSSDIQAIEEACREQGLRFRGVKVIPFSEEVPRIEEPNPVIFYGSTNFIRNVYKQGSWSPAVFFDEELFRYTSWSAKYGEHLLNADAELRTMEEFAEQQYPADKVFFLRPDKDLKEFAGTVMSFGDYQEWCQQLAATDCLLKLDTPMLASEPVVIEKEWRLFIVNGQISSCSLYRQGGELHKRRECPEHVERFVNERLQEWCPDDVFVMDVAQTPERLAIIEINGFNSSGFYNCDIAKIIKDISAFVEKRY